MPDQQANDLRPLLFVEVTVYGLSHSLAKLLESLGLGENRVPDRTSQKSSIACLFNNKGDLGLRLFWVNHLLVSRTTPRNTLSSAGKQLTGSDSNGLFDGKWLVFGIIKLIGCYP